MKTHFSTLLACLMVLALLTAPVASLAQNQPSPMAPAQEQQSPTKEIGTEVGWGVGTELANEIIYPAVKGTYVLTSDHLKGEQPVVFIGPGPDDQPQQQATAPQTQP